MGRNLIKFAFAKDGRPRCAVEDWRQKGLEEAFFEALAVPKYKMIRAWIEAFGALKATQIKTD